MKLSDLLKSIEIVQSQGDLGVEISKVCSDSRKMEKGGVFICIQGFAEDGHKYIPDALNKGAIALISERDIRDIRDVTAVQVRDARLACALMAKSFYGDPSQKLKVIGITGTKGKTSTSYLIHSVLKVAELKPGFNRTTVELKRELKGLIGTTGYIFGDKAITASTTTPDAIELNSLMSQMLEVGLDSVVMEVSSHALQLNRVAGVEFAAAVFTNLTRDHLDFHKDMESYLKAKLTLFSNLSQEATAIVNADDPHAPEVIASTKAKVLTYGVEKDADLLAVSVKSSISGLHFVAATSEAEVEVNLKLLGEYNVYNALAAMGTALALGADLKSIKAGLEALEAVPGRFQMVQCGQDFIVVVDYAHTPDSLEKVLKEAKKLTKHKLITVFGCGGDRDRGKRPIMGQISGDLSDMVIITSDNPRSEAPVAIIEEIEAGIKSTGAVYQLVPDRRMAIGVAISMAQKGDVVVIAGKGHETYQEFKDKKRVHFDDREVAREFLQKIGVR